MELGKLPAVILMLIMAAMLIGIAVIIYGAMSSNHYYTNTIVNESITWPKVGVNASLAHGNITDYILKNATFVTNNEATTKRIIYMVDGHVKNVANGSCADGKKCYIYYHYREYKTGASKPLAELGTEVGNISTTWYGLIVVIVILAMILAIILNFANQRR